MCIGVSVFVVFYSFHVMHGIHCLYSFSFQLTLFDINYPVIV